MYIYPSTSGWNSPDDIKTLMGFDTIEINIVFIIFVVWNGFNKFGGSMDQFDPLSREQSLLHLITPLTSKIACRGERSQ